MMTNVALIHLLLLTTMLLTASPAQAAWQTDETAELGEMDLINRVAELQQALTSDRLPERDSAQAKLIELGPAILDHLEDPDENTPSDARERLAKIRKELETILVRDIVKPTLVTIDKQLTVDEALAEIARQTGNDIAMSENSTAETGQQRIKLKLKEDSFWDAIESVCQQANLAIDPYAGSADHLRLVAKVASPDKTATQEEAPQHAAGIFNFRVTRVDASRHFGASELNHARLGLTVRWEPRIRPISIKLTAENIKATDDADQPLPVSNRKAVFSSLVQPQIPELEFSIPLQLMERSVDHIKTLEAVVEAILPGRTETFRFKNAGKTKPGKQQEKAGAIVTLEGTDKNEDLFGITISLAFSEELNALESHQSWVFENEVYLENETGEPSRPLAYETVRQDNSGVTITYFFADDPGERTLIYKTPAAIVQSSTTISLKNIPLP